MSLRARRGPRTLVAALAGAALLVGALASCAGDEPGTPSPSTTAGPATEEPTPEPTSEPATVELSANGVGEIPWDQPDALPALEELLGPADGVEDFPAECGLADTRTARWGPVTIGLEGGALLSWQVDGDGPLPTGSR